MGSVSAARSDCSRHLKGLLGIWCVSDDVIVAAKNQQDRNVKDPGSTRMLSTLWHKTELRSEVFLGHIIYWDPSKIEALLHMPPPGVNSNNLLMKKYNCPPKLLCYEEEELVLQL